MCAWPSVASLEFVQSLSLADDLPTFFIKYDIATRNRVETCRDFYDASAAAAAPVDWRRFWAWSALQWSALHWCTCTVAKCLARLGLIDLCFISARLIHRSWRPLITSLLVRSLIVYKPWFPRIQLNCSWWKRSSGAAASTPRWFKPRAALTAAFWRSPFVNWFESFFDRAHWFRLIH